MTICISLIVIILATFSSSALIQDTPEEVKFQDKKAKVMRALEGKEEGWKAVKHSPNGTKMIISTYRNKNEHVVFSVAEGDDINEAKGWHDEAKQTTSVGAFQTISGIGDDAYVVASVATGSASLRLRVGKFVMGINAPSEELAIKFAKHLVKEFTGK